MKKVALKIAYIGTHFHGFQRQPNLRTIEGEIIFTLKKLGYIDDLQKSNFSIGGRTDKGVHSLGNVISFITDKEILINQINHSLPDDIQVLAIAPVRYGFRPRYALMRYYRYMFFEEDLDIRAMERLSKVFLGEHNFINFSKRDQKTPVRKIDEINIINPNSEKNRELIKFKPIMGKTIKYREERKKTMDINERENLVGFSNDIDRFNQENMDNFDSIFVDVYGESFLWNMIRKMMRIFLLVGKNQMEIDEVEKFFNPDEKFNIKPLESENLILMDTSYANINFKYDEYACERFRRYLIDNLFNYKMNHSIENNILCSMGEILNNNTNYLNIDENRDNS